MEKGGKKMKKQKTYVCYSCNLKSKDKPFAVAKIDYPLPVSAKLCSIWCWRNFLVGELAILIDLDYEEDFFCILTKKLRDKELLKYVKKLAVLSNKTPKGGTRKCSSKQ